MDGLDNRPVCLLCAVWGKHPNESEWQPGCANHITNTFVVGSTWIHEYFLLIIRSKDNNCDVCIAVRWTSSWTFDPPYWKVTWSSLQAI